MKSIKTDGELFSKALKRFEETQTSDREQRRLAIEDMLFVNAEDGQWDDEISEKRKDRPRYTIDRISGAIDQIVGNQRQTRTGIKVSPETGSDEKTAEIFTGLIRSIEKESSADNAYDAAFDEQLTGGYGGWRVLTEYGGDETFDQIISIKPINSAASSLFFDPSAKEYDKRDAKWGFLTSSMLLSDFKEKYPNASVTDFSKEMYQNDNMLPWFGGEGVLLAEYWYKKPVKRKIGLLSDGRVIDMGEEEKVLDELALKGAMVVKTRVVDSHEVEMVVMNGAEFLTKPQKWGGKYIPLVPVYGRVAMVDDKIYIRGKVRKAKDAQRIYNYATSAAIEATALTPKDPIWITPNQAKGHEASLRTFPTQNSPFMIYNPDPLAPGIPGRGGAPTLQTALLQQVSQAATDIHATTGLEPASLGNSPELKSGKAIEAQQAMGDRGSFIYEDNLRKSKQYTGAILVDLIPRTYDTERVIKVLGADETLRDVTINKGEFSALNDPIIDNQTGEQVIVNDLSQGSYSVTVTTGPSFSTKRKETVNQLVTLAGSSELIRDLALDLIVENMDLNKGDEVKARIRKDMIKKGVIEPSEEEAKEMGLDKAPPVDPMNEALVKNLDAQTEKLLIGNEKIIAEVMNKDADTQSKIMSTQKASIDALTALTKSILDKVNTGAQITDTDIDLIEGQQALVQETQADVIEGQELAGSNPVGKVNIQQPPQGQPPAQGQSLPPDNIVIP